MTSIEEEMTQKQTLREKLEQLFSDEGARPACFAAIDKIVDLAIGTLCPADSCTIGDSLMKISTAGWNVAFPRFKNTRAFTLSIAKGGVIQSESWTSDEVLCEKLAALVRVVENFEAPSTE